MSSRFWEWTFRWDSVAGGTPGNNQIIVPIDSTRGPANLLYAPVNAGSSILIPGPWRGHYPLCMIRYSIRGSGFDVTLAEQVLTGNAGTAADWETSNTVNIVAGATAVREFKPLALDWRVRITAGATGPTDLVLWGTAAFTQDYAG